MNQCKPCSGLLIILIFLCVNVGLVNAQDDITKAQRLKLKQDAHRIHLRIHSMYRAGEKVGDSQPPTREEMRL
jgi:hypothetical protein